MTQKSYPWPGVAPASGADAGRYTAPEWWAHMAARQRASGIVITSPLLRTDSDFTNIGVYYSIGNQVAVTSPGNNRINVNTGAWLNDGQFGYNDVSIGSAGNIVSPAANPRIDRVVLRKNFTSNEYDPTNGNADFDVPALTTRVTIISGAEAGAPVAPSLVQDTARNPAGAFGTDGTWDIPLAQFEISIGGVISNLTDEREWVDAETKRMFSTIQVGESGATISLAAPLGNFPTIAFPDSEIDFGFGAIFAVPSDFIADMTVNCALTHVSGGAKDVFGSVSVTYSACDEQYVLGGHSDTSGESAESVTSGAVACLWEITLSAVAIGDTVKSVVKRDSTDPLDTINGIVYILGFNVEYLGWR